MYDVHQITVPEFWPVSFDHHHIISYAIAFWLFVVFVFPAKIKNETVSPFKQKICKVNHVCMQRPGSGVTIIGGHGVWDPDHRCAPEKFWGSDFSFWGLGGSPILGGSARVWGVLPIQSISSKKFLGSKNVCGGPKNPQIPCSPMVWTPIPELDPAKFSAAYTLYRADPQHWRTPEILYISRS